MQVQREFSSEIAEKLEMLPIKERQKILGISSTKEISTQKEKSSAIPLKWARFVDEIRNDPDLKDPEFKKAWKKVKEGMQEVHENFEFQHDQ